MLKIEHVFVAISQLSILRSQGATVVLGEFDGDRLTFTSLLLHYSLVCLCPLLQVQLPFMSNLAHQVPLGNESIPVFISDQSNLFPQALELFPILLNIALFFIISDHYSTLSFPKSPQEGAMQFSGQKAFLDHNFGSDVLLFPFFAQF